jgi:hypothetical protein
MGQLADNIETAATANIPAAPAASAADLMTGPDLLQIFGEVAAAVRFLEGLAAGADIIMLPAAPGAADGNDGDAFINTTAGGSLDLFKKVAGVWQQQGSLKGTAGSNGKSTYQLWLDAGNSGTLLQFLATQKGADGKSSYQLWLDAGNAGTVAQFLLSLKGTNGKSSYQLWLDAGNVGTLQQFIELQTGKDGAPGSVNQWKSYAPTTEPGTVGAAWFHNISATKVAIYECLTAPDGAGHSTWGLRFTSPDAAASSVVSSGGGTVKSVNGQNPDAAGNVVVNAGSSLPTQAGNQGKVLGTDGTNPLWVAAATAGDSLPAQVGQQGKVLATDGTAATWQKLIDDSTTGTGASWSSQKITDYIKSGASFSFRFRSGDTTRAATFFTKILIDSFRTCQGGNSYTFSLVLSDGTVVTSATSPGAITVAIGNLTPVQLTAGYDVQLEYTGTSLVATSIMQTFPVI